MRQHVFFKTISLLLALALSAGLLAVPAAASGCEHLVTGTRSEQLSCTEMGATVTTCLDCGEERAAELLAEYQSWLRRFAAAFRLPVLDFDRAFTRWGEEGLFQPDGLHPNAAGHCLMAETAAALIRSL